MTIPTGFTLGREDIRLSPQVVENLPDKYYELYTGKKRKKYPTMPRWKLAPPPESAQWAEQDWADYIRRQSNLAQAGVRPEMTEWTTKEWQQFIDEQEALEKAEQSKYYQFIRGKLPLPIRFLTHEEVAELGGQIPEGWKLKVQGEEQTLVNPQGRELTVQEYEQEQHGAAPMFPPTYLTGFPQPTVPQIGKPAIELAAPLEFPLTVEQLPEEVRTLLGYVYPGGERPAEEVLTWLGEGEANLEQFLTDIQTVGG